ncbi:DUF6233 domain-containing protein [Streptomyces sp. 796.1]|uniref:DUF6233 domain-containing protein n=1 Tax=Streptomyces sp. 796.1 TaxID=3163029 RepID=UPI0039C8E40D
MPDGQELDVVVTGRERMPDGTWWYMADAILPGRETGPAGIRPVGTPTPIVLPADRVTPIPGQDYSGVPTGGALPGRRWLLEKARERGKGPWWRAHRQDCGQAPAGAERASADAARGLLRSGEAMPCEACRPDRAL